MGKVMSRAHGHLFTRTMQRFNIEARTEQLLELDKPVAAPKHRSDLEANQQMSKRDWEQMEKNVKLKDLPHSNRLKDVYVLSEDPEDFVPRPANNPDRPLPKSTTSRMRRSGFSTIDEESVPVGKFTLQSVQELLLEHKSDPQRNNAGALAAKHRLSLAVTEALIDHHRIFTYIKVKAKMATAKEIQDKRDPYRAQKDWVEYTGELPPPGGFDPKVDRTVLEIVTQPPEEVGLKLSPSSHQRLITRDTLSSDQPTEKKKLPKQETR